MKNQKKTVIVLQVYTIFWVSLQVYNCCERLGKTKAEMPRRLVSAAALLWGVLLLATLVVILVPPHKSLFLLILISINLDLLSVLIICLNCCTIAYDFDFRIDLAMIKSYPSQTPSKAKVRLLRWGSCSNQPNFCGNKQSLWFVFPDLAGKWWFGTSDPPSLFRYRNRRKTNWYEFYNRWINCPQNFLGGC